MTNIETRRALTAMAALAALEFMPTPRQSGQLINIEEPDMPPYKPVVSQAQRRLLFAKANRGEIAMSEAEGKARAAKGRSLPERVGHARAGSGRRRASRKGRR